jgi:hypothetical protein
MTPSLAPGDWRRSTLDHRAVCRPGARAASRGIGRMRLGERRSVTRVDDEVFLGRL